MGSLTPPPTAKLLEEKGQWMPLKIQAQPSVSVRYTHMLGSCGSAAWWSLGAGATSLIGGGSCALDAPVLVSGEKSPSPLCWRPAPSAPVWCLSDLTASNREEHFLLRNAPIIEFCSLPSLGVRTDHIRSQSGLPKEWESEGGCRSSAPSSRAGDCVVPCLTHPFLTSHRCRPLQTAFFPS